MIDIFTILILTHFVSDWFLQPEKWGVGKHKYVKYLLYHSIQYTILFLIVFYFLEINLIWGVWIFLTHFIIDTYIPVRLWSKYILGAKNPREWILVIRDQILHILILIPILYL